MGDNFWTHEQYGPPEPDLDQRGGVKGMLLRRELETTRMDIRGDRFAFGKPGNYQVGYLEGLKKAMQIMGIRDEGGQNVV